MILDFASCLGVLQKEGLRLAEVTGQVSLDTAVPSCPDWVVRDLVRHTGWVHRWAGLVISEGRTEPPSDLREPIPAGWPSDAGLLDWFREGHERVVRALESAPADLRCWTIMDAPEPRAFWARRQAHETSIHRVDAELAAGNVSGFDPVHAADGIDELLVWFIDRPGRGPTAPEELTLGVHATDVNRAWTARFGPEGAQGRRGMGEAGCTVSGDAGDLYPYLWSRTPLGGLHVDGDPAVLGQWRESSSF
ncbi:MAG: maleylpyruvate isomerase family mycothiol-dependent enzyme [bacterium]|nr:maleylpyruvate isomerase family mycothiol-dependent enzyme [bacterium]